MNEFRTPAPPPREAEVLMPPISREFLEWLGKLKVPEHFAFPNVTPDQALTQLSYNKGMKHVIDAVSRGHQRNLRQEKPGETTFDFPRRTS